MLNPLESVKASGGVTHTETEENSLQLLLPEQSFPLYKLKKNVILRKELLHAVTIAVKGI
jgi:hypothetical protein